jgi:hypothetical protein
MASAELLQALPSFSSFQDQLSMECRRHAATKQNLSVLIVSTEMSGNQLEPGLSISCLGDAAIAITRKLRGEDSVYLVASNHFGVILPGIDRDTAQKISGRLKEGLEDAAGVSNRFTFKIDSISYPEQASSARDLELAVTDFLPGNGLNQTTGRAARVSQ